MANRWEPKTIEINVSDIEKREQRARFEEVAGSSRPWSTRSKLRLKDSGLIFTSEEITSKGSWPCFRDD